MLLDGSDGGHWLVFISSYIPENDEVMRLKLEHKKSTEEIRKIIEESSKKFKAFENWKWNLI